MAMAMVMATATVTERKKVSDGNILLLNRTGATGEQKNCPSDVRTSEGLNYLRQTDSFCTSMAPRAWGNAADCYERC